MPELPVQMVCRGSRQQALTLDKEAAREIVYGMPYAEWKAHYQTEATPEQTAAFAAQQNPSGGE